MRRSIVLLPLLALAACQAATNPDELDPLADAGAFCDSVFDVLLTRQVECGVFADALLRAEYPSYVAFCGLIGDSAEAGRMGFDREKAEACLALVRAAACESADGALEGEACDEVFFGKVPAGGTCSLDGDCAAETAGCFYGATCPGVCKAYGGPGASCGSAGDPSCDADLYCNANGACEARLPVDALCLDNEWACAQGAYCAATLTPPVCRPMAQEGESCVARPCDGESPRDLFCQDGTCAATPVAAGETCDSDWQCEATAFCQLDVEQRGKCVRRQESGACTDDEACVANARCVKASSTAVEGSCRELARVGESCTAGENLCVFGAACDGDAIGRSGTCRAWPGEGGTCGILSGEVVGCTGSYCAGADEDGIGTCEAWKRPGESCTHFNECGPEGTEFGAWCDERDGVCVEPGVCAD
jgi:hypothetical protein